MDSNLLDTKLFLVKNCKGWQAAHLSLLCFGSNKYVLCQKFSFLKEIALYVVLLNFGKVVVGFVWDSTFSLRPLL